MNKGNVIKWALLVMLLLTDIFSTIALVYSVIKSQVLITGNDPFILNVAMILSIIVAALWVITFLIVYVIKIDSTLEQRIITVERILMERGINTRN